MRPSRNLDRFFRPRSIAIIGASEDFRKINGRPLKFLLDKKYAGKIFPINPKYETLAELKCFPDLASIPEPVDLAIIAVPAAAVARAVEGCVAKKVGGAVVFSSGFGEMGAEGRAEEERIARIAAEGGLPLCGPNTLGFWNAFERVMATFSQAGDDDVPPGPIGFVTQSGAFGTAIVALAKLRGLVLGYFVNSGNESDLRFSELLRYVVHDDNVRVAAGYIEGLKDGGLLLEVADEALDAGKPLVLIKVGRSQAGARAALSHTGSLSGSDAVYTGVFKQHAIVRADNEEELLDYVAALSLCALPAGKRIGIVTQSGGAGVQMADRAEALGLDLAEFTPETNTALRTVIPAFGSIKNPVDITAQFIAEPALLRDALTLVLNDPNVDIAVFYLGLMGPATDTIVKNLAAVAQATTKPLLVGWAAAAPGAAEKMLAAGLCMLPGATRAVSAASALVRYADARRRRLAERSGAAARPAIPARNGKAVASVAASSADTFALLEGRGIKVAPWRIARSATAAASAARELGFPVALKIESAQIQHKTEIGGVRLHLSNEAEVSEAYAAVVAAATQHAPAAKVDGVLVQRMISADAEIIVGVQRDPSFGPVVMVGLGGIFVEILGDVSFRAAPFGRETAREMLEDLRGYPLLTGARGRPPCDVEAAVDILVRVSHLAAEQPDLEELDLNPIKVLGVGQGAVAVDAMRVVSASERR